MKIVLGKKEVNELLKKAEELRQHIGEISIAHEDFNPGRLRDPSKSNRSLIVPTISQVDNNIICNGYTIPTDGKVLTIRLFEAFENQLDLRLTREQLAEAIYKHRFTHASSERIRKSILHNVVKVISRARHLANDVTNANGFKWIEWFPEDGEGWTLYRLTNSFIREREIAVSQLIHQFNPPKKVEAKGKGEI